MHYIYLNTYANGCLYVGSHTWKGEGLDPNYHGSSVWAKFKGWNPVKEEILEIVDEDLNKHKRETYWIEMYCERFGILPQVKYAANKHGNYWTNKYKDGLCINAHCNTGEQLRSEEVASKRLESRRKTGYKSFVEASLKARTKDSYKRMIETKRSKGVLGDASQMHTTEVQKRACETRKKNGYKTESHFSYSKETIDKIQESRKKFYKENPEIGIKFSKLMHSKEVEEKRRETRLKNAGKYVVEKDGVIVLESNWKSVREFLKTRSLRSIDVVGEIRFKGYKIWHR